MSVIIKYIVLCILISVWLNAHGEMRWIPTMDGSLGYDSNISRAQDERNIISDQFARFDARLALKKELTFNKAIIVEGQASHQAHQYSTLLDQSELSARFMYRWQNRFGYQAPWYQVMFESKLLEGQVEQRNSNVYKIQAMASARLTTQISWVAGAESALQDSEGSVFDTQQHRLFLHVDYNLRGGPLMYGGVSLMQGDTISSVQSVYCNGLTAVDTYPLIVASDAIEWDEAFSGDYCGTWISYRLSAQTYVGTLGINYPLSPKLALDASIMAVDVQAQDNIEYQRQIIQINLLKAF